MPEPEISVLLVDDHSLVRRGFRRMLEDDPGIRVVGEASDGHEAVEAVGALKPHVVVMDFALPSMNGAVATRRIRELYPADRGADSQHARGAELCTHLSRSGGARLPAEECDGPGTGVGGRKVAAGEQVLDPRLGKLADAAEAPS